MAKPCVSVSMDHLCCPICSELFRNPVTIHCGHNFCLHCIQDCWERGSCIKCPECGWIFSSRPELIMNTTLAEMVQDAAKRYRLAERSWQQHPGASLHPEKRSRTSAETRTPDSNLCRKHNRCLDAYCCTDQLILCSLCAAEHQGHDIGSVQLERRRKQEELNEMQNKSKQLLQQEEKECGDMRKVLGEIKEEARQTVDGCEIAVSGVIDSLQRYYLSVKELIAAQEQAATAQVQLRLRTLQENTERKRSRHSELDGLAQMESDIRFLQEWPSRVTPLCQSNQQPLEDPLLPLKTTRSNAEQICRQLEDLCGKEFRALCLRGFSGVEPTTRPQFLRYACELTLDPATAHKDLLISAGDKKVKLSPQTAAVVQSAERFQKRRQVLCREGLQAERCYYEVEVEGDKAEIALTYKGINRKSSTKVSCFGGNPNSWSLDRSKVYSVSHNNEGVQLTAAPSHHRIGVYLKFREGTLTFYEVSDSMKFLYRVEAEFKEPLYPGFWLGDKCRIRISDLKQRE